MVYGLAPAQRRKLIVADALPNVNSPIRSIAIASLPIGLVAMRTGVSDHSGAQFARL